MARPNRMAFRPQIDLLPTRLAPSDIVPIPASIPIQSLPGDPPPSIIQRAAENGTFANPSLYPPYAPPSFPDSGVVATGCWQYPDLTTPG